MKLHVYAIFSTFLLITLSPKAADRLSIFDDVNQKGYGTVSGNIQTLFMGRLYSVETTNNDQLHSGSTAITLNYYSPEIAGLSLGSQYVHSLKLYSRGDEEDIGNTDPAYNLSNSDFSILNNAYIRYNFEGLGLKNSFLTAGRQTLNLNFATPYNIRQNEQAYEAIVLDIGSNDDLQLSVGIIDKFSSWTSRDDLTTGSSANSFIDIEDVETVPYSTNGFQFIDMTYSGINRTTLTLYDYYGDRLYNTFGANIDYTFIQSEDFETDLRLKYISQRGVSKFDKFRGIKLRADAVQGGIKFKRGNFSIEPGVFMIAGDNVENDIHSPFQPRFIVEEPLFETDIGFAGGSRSLYIEGSHSWSKNSLYFLYLYTDADSPAVRGENSEWDIILSRNITENIYAKLKVGLVNYNDKAGDDTVFDYRIFLGWKM